MKFLNIPQVFVVGGLTVLLTFCCTPPAANAQPERMNVVLILMDDLGWTDVGFMGGDLYETPNLDRLARSGMRFTNAYSACTVCSPTRAAVMTGKYPARLHVTDWIHGHKRPNAKLSIPEWTHHLPLDEVTIAEVLKNHGYTSASIGKWHLGDEPEYFPDRQGFDVNIAGCGKGSPPSYFAPYNIPTLKDGPKGEYLTDRLTDEACKFITDNRAKPFFVYLPHHAVHTPLQAKQEVVSHYAARIKPGLKHTNAVYAAMIQSMDESVGRVLKTLDDNGLAERTIVIFTSDNGGLLQSTSNLPLRAGKGSTYEGGVRVPLVIRWPGTTEADSACHEPVMSIDLFPTLLELTQASPEARAAVDGVSLMPLLRDPSVQLTRAALYWHYPHYHPGGATPYGAIRMRDWKLVEFYEDHRVELYHLSDDLGETKELSKAEPTKAAALRDKLHAWREEVGAQMPTPNPDYDPAKLPELPRAKRPRQAARAS